MAKPRPEKKRQKPKHVSKPVQPPLPGMPPPEPPGTTRVLPMQLQIGDQITDESGTWQVIARPYSLAGGKNTQVRVQRVDTPGATETRLWGSYEKVTVIRRGPPERASDDAIASSFSDLRGLTAHLGCDGLRRVCVGVEKRY